MGGGEMSLSAVASPNLGISAKSLHTLKPKAKKSNALGRMDAKARRYDLQRKAQSIMYNAEGGKQHRVCGCCRNVASDGVPVYRTLAGDNARFGNLVTCGSVWACPVCSAKITEVRRAELQAAVASWASMGGKVVLLTLTFPHHDYDELQPLLDKFGKALQLFKNSRSYKGAFGTPKMPGRYQRAGSVRSLEVTHGDNGWHPHTHDLVFVKRDGLTDDVQTIEELKGAWVKALLKAGIGSTGEITDMFAHGLDIRGGDYAAEYIAKYGREAVNSDGWSVSHEVTKNHSKAGTSGGHATPFQLLEWAMNGDDESGQLFKEFVNCFDGKRMNYWSPGLRKLLAVDEIEDEAIAADESSDDAEELVIRLDVDQWRLVLETNARGEILKQAAAAGLPGVLQLLDELKTRPKIYRGWFNDNARPDVSRFFH